MKIYNSKHRHTGIIAALIAVVSIFSSCKKDFLDRDPQGSYTEDTYPYPGGSGPYDEFIFGAYEALRSYDVTVFPFIAATSIRSDDADKGSTTGDGPEAFQMDNFTISPSNGMTNALWLGHLNMVNRCNYVLDRVAADSILNTPEERKTSAIAEARFLRGYAYFMLVRLFGRVPLMEQYSVSTQTNIPQSEPAEIYAFIEEDLSFAAANLPSSWGDAFPGRATSGAANGLLAKVYLTQNKWSLAMSTANQVITSGLYDLSTPYDVIFDEEGENSKESIFEVQATASLTEKRAYGSQYASVQGVRGTGDWNLGWGFNVPSETLERAYEPGDPRRRRTILYQDSLSVYGERIPISDVNPPRYNHKSHSDPARRKALLDNFSYWMNVRLLRYADVVLMYAEAANELGNSTEALDKLEMVRARARGGNNNILPRVTTTDQEELRQAIRHERRVELGMEHERFFDLVRWGTAAQALQAAGKNFVTGRDELLPIPQVQIDLSNGVLKPNPGY